MSSIFHLPIVSLPSCTASEETQKHTKSHIDEICYTLQKNREDDMPTLEERLVALERALATMKGEQVADIQQLDERMSALHQQIAEQRRRIAEREQDTQHANQAIADMHQQVDGLVSVLTQQFSAVHQQFAAINARFDATDTSLYQHFTSIATNFRQMDSRFDEQSHALRAQFAETNMAVTAVTTTAGQQGQDIRIMKEDIRTIAGSLGGVDERLEVIQSRQESAEQKLDTVIALLQNPPTLE
jgi:chromosome segregation ATPase